MRARLRASIITVAVAINVIGAYPTPGIVSEERLREGPAKKELDRWVERLRGLGVDTDAERLGRAYVRVSNSATEFKRAVVEPFRPFYELTGTRQGWRLFALPDEHPHALRITGHKQGKTAVLYESNHPERQFMAGLLEFRRVRSMLNPSSSGPPNTYDALARRLSERAFEEDPELERVTISLVESHTTLPGEEPDPARAEHFVHSFARGEP